MIVLQMLYVSTELNSHNILADSLRQHFLSPISFYLSRKTVVKKIDEINRLQTLLISSRLPYPPDSAVGNAS